MAIWKRAMDYLGLGSDDAYDDYDYPVEPERPTRASRPTREPEPVARQQRGYAPEPEPEVGVRSVGRGGYSSREPEQSGRRPVPAPDESGVQPRPINGPRQASSVRAVPAGSTGEPHTVRPRRFDAAQELADKFKEGLPVIMNLEGTEREVSRRLIDFASGLCYGLDGSMEKVATGVYLLKPTPPHGGHRAADNAG